MNIVSVIDNLELEIPDSPLGITVSGGADSALLLYFLLKHSTNKLHIFTLANQSKNICNALASVNIVSKCAELTNNYNFLHHISYSTTQTSEKLFNTPKQYYNNKTITHVYTGITKDPPKSVTDTFNQTTTETHERDPNLVRNTKDGIGFTPWTNIDKKYLCKIYEKYNLLENLFPLTRSCEWIKEFNTPDPGMGHCGECWWCEERQWGFGTNG